MTFAMYVALIVGLPLAAYLLFCMVMVWVLAFKDELPDRSEEPWFVTAHIGGVLHLIAAVTLVVVALIGLGDFIHVWTS